MRDKNEGEACVLTFVIVVLFRPICCHETPQSGSTHVPAARPLIDLEETGMIAEGFRRKVFRYCGRAEVNMGIIYTLIDGVMVPSAIVFTV